MTRASGTRSAESRVAPERSAIIQRLERATHYQREGDLARAEPLYREVLAKEPGNIPAMHLLGGILLQTDRNEEAVALLEGATGVAPSHAILFANLGEAYRRCGDFARATATLNRALALKPDLAEASYTLGLVTSAGGLFERAIDAFERALAVKPSLLLGHIHLSSALVAAGRLDDAGSACERALVIEPSFADAHNQLGIVRKEQGRADEAIRHFRQALEFQPDHRIAHSNLVFGLSLGRGETPASILAETRRWEERQLAGTPRDARPLANDRDRKRRLRVGFVSPDFRNHCQAFYTIPLFEHRERDAVEVFCYSAVEAPDPVTDRIRGLADHFRDISRATDAVAVDAIRRDRIDVLVDLAMHMGENRIGVFAAKPAPVQVAWLAYPGTTGLGAMDYRLTDPWLDPPDGGTDGFYTEASLRLPDSFWCYDPLTSEPDVGPLPAASEGHVTFGSLNSFGKTNPDVLDLWARVLAAVPRSRMLLLAYPGESRTRALEAFARAGVAADRVEFVPYQPRAQYLATYRRIDIALDTFPVNGHTTSLDAFWMGVPVVTLVGPTALGRAGLEYAHHLDLDDLVATTPDQYASIAAGLAADVPRLERLRAELRGRMQRSPLMDGPGFARAFAAAIRTMWHRWCDSPPRHSAKELSDYAAGLVIGGRRDQVDLAVEVLERAIEIDPTCAAALCNLGVLEGEAGRWDDAATHFRRATEVQPDLAEAHHDLGNALVRAGFVSEAIASYRRATALLPGNPDIHSALVYYLHFLPRYSARDVLAEAREWNRRHGVPLASSIVRHTNDRSPDRRLRIGYVSPDFRHHCQAFFVMPLLAHHDHREFEIFCYSDVAKPDDWTERMFASCDQSRSIVGWSHQAVAERIRADRIDVLVDLTMHMGNNRLPVFARKPAPVQVSWLAYPGTTGLDAIDYRITDRILDPPEDEALEGERYSEKSLHLPETFWCFHPLTSEASANALPARTNGHIRFGCLNGFYKVNDAVYALWARVLHAVEGSRLVLMAPPGAGRRAAIAALEGHGIGEDRVDFVDYQPRLPYLATYRTIDVCLDTFPYNGHTTSLDAMWMGVPVVTLVGDTVVGRAGLCQATALELKELVAYSPDEYVTIASRLCGDLDRLAELRASLRDRMQRSPLTDAPRFTRNLEAAYRRAWRRRCKRVD